MSSSSGPPISRIPPTCETEKNQLLVRCHKSRYDCPLAQLRSALSSMCSDQNGEDLKEASYRAGEQMLLIVGVVSLCCLLYLLSALAEAFCCSKIRTKAAAALPMNYGLSGSRRNTTVALHLGSALQDHDIEDLSHSHYDEEAVVSNESESEITLTEDKISNQDHHSVVSVRMVSPEGNKKKKRSFRGYSYKKRKKKTDHKEEEPGIQDEKLKEQKEENTWQL